MAKLTVKLDDGIHICTLHRRAEQCQLRVKIGGMPNGRPFLCLALWKVFMTPDETGIERPTAAFPLPGRTVTIRAGEIEQFLEAMETVRNRFRHEKELARCLKVIREADREIAEQRELQVDTGPTDESTSAKMHTPRKEPDND